MIRTITTFFAIGILFPLLSFSQTTKALPTFTDYDVPVYRGKVVRPKWIRFKRGDGWRDNLGKLVDSPEVNFGGKYFAVLHSCGTGCRYYTLTDLTTGKELNALNGFGAGEEPPKTKEGYQYRERLVFWPNSVLLIVQYDVETPSETQCRERSFVLQSQKLKPVTPTIYSCRDLD